MRTDWASEAFVASGGLPLIPSLGGGETREQSHRDAKEKQSAEALEYEVKERGVPLLTRGGSTLRFTAL